MSLKLPDRFQKSDIFQVSHMQRIEANWKTSFLKGKEAMLQFLQDRLLYNKVGI